jgi:hypothetical protein
MDMPQMLGTVSYRSPRGGTSDFSNIMQNGLDASRAPTWVTTDPAAAADAIGPARAAVEGGLSDPGIIESQIPRSLFDQVMGAARPYSGFYGAGLDSSEIVLRTQEQFDLFNRFMVGAQ